MGHTTHCHNCGIDLLPREITDGDCNMCGRSLLASARRRRMMAHARLAGYVDGLNGDTGADAYRATLTGELREQYELGVSESRRKGE